jgi:hypothetical protein
MWFSEQLLTLAGTRNPSDVIATGDPFFPCVRFIETYVIRRRCRFRSQRGSELGPTSAPRSSSRGPGLRHFLGFACVRPTTPSPTMSLVLYPDSESDDDDDDDKAAQASSAGVKTPAKRKRSDAGRHASSELPPLPAAFHDLYSTNARTSTSDDPSLHGGRKRAVPHIEGNWPSHLYLECMHPSLLPRVLEHG